jgi:hypothetical protein
MTSPLLRLLASQPALLVDHAVAYAHLVEAEIDRVLTRSERRALWGAAELCNLTAAGVLAGVALMVASVSPQLSPLAVAVLIGTPLLPLLLAAWLHWQLRRPVVEKPFDTLRNQWRADVQLLKGHDTP